MALIERDAAMAELAPFLIGVPRAFREAWQRARSDNPINLIDQTKTTRAGLVRDYAVGALTRMWNGNTDVYTCQPGQQFLFLIARKFAIRIKKFDQASCSSNYPTEQDQNYRQQGEIEEVGFAYNMEIGYVLNSSETDVDDVRIVCLNGEYPYWWQSIEQPADNVYDLFQGQRDPNSPPPSVSPKEIPGVKIEPKKR